MENKVYLGDAVYLSNDGFQLVLSTESSPFGPGQTIYLQADMIETIRKYSVRFGFLRENENAD